MPQMSERAPFLTGKRRERFEALQRCLVPRSAKFSTAQWEKSRTMVNEILADKPRAIHRKIGFFLWVIDVVSVMLAGKTVAHLPSENHKKVMDWFYDSPISLFRKGFWGVNTLAKLGVYGQAELYDEIGYVKKPMQGTP